MSKYGVIEVNVYDHYTSEELEAFAKKHSITYETAVSLARENVWRKKYNQLRNKDAEVRASRKQYNQKRNSLRKELR